MQETRESLGIDLEDSIVIVDEGHNLVDAVNAVHSAVISRSQLAIAKSALDTYSACFSSRLAPGASPQSFHCLDRICAIGVSVMGGIP